MTTPGGYPTPSAQISAEQAQRQRYLQLKASLTAEQAANIGSLARENPSLSPGALYSAGRAGVQPGTPASKAMGEADIKVKASKGGFSFGSMVRKAKKGLDRITPDALEDPLKDGYGVVKGVSRGAFGIAQAPAQAIQGAFRETVSDGEFAGTDFINAVSPIAFAARVANNLDETSIAAMVRQIQKGGLDSVDVGSGFFIGGAAADEQRERAINQAPVTINGERVGQTVGRYYANKLDLQPGGTAFNVVSGLADASIAVAADPTTYAAPVTKAFQARALFAGNASKGFTKGLESGVAQAKIAEDLRLEMGAVEGLRDTVNSDRVFEYLTKDKRGRTLVQYLAREDDFGRALDATNGKLDPKLLLQLTERQHSPDEIIGILGPVLGRTAGTESKFGVDAVAKVTQGLQGGGIGGVGTLATAKFKSARDSTRLFGTVPERVLPKDDLPTALRNMDNFLKNAKISGPERSTVLKKLAQTSDADEMLEVAIDAMSLGVSKAEGLGVDAEAARSLFRIYANSRSDRIAFWQGQIAADNGRYGNKAFGLTEDVRVLDDGQTAALPHLASQFLDQNIPLPDPREIRRAISPFRGVLSNTAVEKPLMFLEKVSDNIFKPGVLLRPAYIVRNQIDEQFRPAGMGLNSMFNHPIQYIAWLMHDQSGVGKALGKVGVQTGRGSRDAAGVAFDPVPELRTALREAKRNGDPAVIDAAQAAFDQARNARALGARSGDETALSDTATQYLRSISGGVGNWRNKSRAELDGSALFQRSDADYSRAAAENLHLIHTDPLAMRVANGGPLPEDGIATQGVEGLKEWWWSGGGARAREDLAKNSQRMSWLNDQAGADRYVDDTLTFVDDLVGQSVELRQAAATGGVNGVPLFKPGTLDVDPRAIAQLDAMKVDPAFLGPQAVAGKVMLKGAQAAKESTYSRVVDALFYQIADRPTAYLSKSPVFRQRYYQRLENLVGFMDAQAQQKAIQGARDAGMKGSYIKRLQAKVKPGRTNNRISFAEADLVAKTDAVEYTRDLYYSLHDRSQFFDITRLLFPFGEAFKDSLTKYASITANNPVLPYRLGQVVQGARNADPDGDGEGIFYTDEITGDEMVAWPGSGLLMDGLGASKLASPVKNLNILGQSVLPGFGPVMQLAAGAVLPDTPDYDAIRSLINPYGDRTLDGGALESFLPSWFTKATLALNTDGFNGKQQQAFVNAQKDVMGYLASTGEYDLQDPDDILRLQQDAKTRARGLFFVRGLAQAFLPSPPSPQMIAYDKDGILQTQAALAGEYRKIQDEQQQKGTPEQTNRLFIEKFGPDAVLAAISNTKAGENRSPVAPKKESEDFRQANSKTAEKFPTVFGLFAPTGEGDPELDFPAYARQLKTGERVVITPDEAVRRTNQRLASMIFQQAKDLAGAEPTPAEKEELKKLRSKLSEDFPGYSTSFSNTTPQMLEDLKRAAKDPVLSKTPPGQGLKIWLEARTAAEARAQEVFGAGWARADSSRPIRDAMRDLADRLGRDFPGFTEMYERALENEMIKDTPADAGAN